MRRPTGSCDPYGMIQVYKEAVHSGPIVSGLITGSALNTDGEHHVYDPTKESAICVFLCPGMARSQKGGRRVSGLSE